MTARSDRMRGDVADLSDVMTVDERKTAVIAVHDPADLAWLDYGVEVIIESTGKFGTGVAAAAHIVAGATKLLTFASGKGVEAIIVLVSTTSRLAQAATTSPPTRRARPTASRR